MPIIQPESYIWNLCAEFSHETRNCLDSEVDRVCRFNSLGTANTLFEGTGDLTCANKIKNYAAKRIGEAQLSRNALYDSGG